MIINEKNEIVDKIIERAVLVGFNNDKGHIDIKYSMLELKELALAAGCQVSDSIIQNKKTIDAVFYIGKGKIDEVKALVEMHDANLVIFNDELSGAQQRNIENVVEARVIDRTVLILDIFAKRAKSKVSKLQVELAQLRYRLPRLKGSRSNLSKTGAGIGTRGPGEQKLEIDKRRINERVTDIRKSLEEARLVRNLQRVKRSKNEIPIVAIVGYTNAGKSTLMNKLIADTNVEDTDKHVFVKDMLFATLDTFHRKITLGDNKDVIIVDTVGFVSKLPHSLVEAFKATLEEVTEADLLLHVVDSTNLDYNNQIKITESVLNELNVRDKKTIFVYNKSDLLNEEIDLINENDILISAVKGDGIDELKEKIKKIVFDDLKIVKMLLPFNKGYIYSELCSIANVISTEYIEEGTLVEVEVSDKEYNKYKEFIL
ncbi:GTPase HflX [Helicovermis profundi]|uniref:GTPase HflX n=1 Tax=Helicovermis profundi TaxID=3065157 RepID=A0AAU9ED80_9FIRM|nr:GTPase HflX [Clostridia bacterium S502]